MKMKLYAALAAVLLLGSCSYSQPVGSESGLPDPIRQAREFKGYDHWRAGGFELIREGKANATLVIPARALPVHEYAAQELVEHIQKTTGAAIPIVREGQTVSTPGRIYVGHVQALQIEKVAQLPVAIATSFIIPPVQIQPRGATKIRQAAEVSDKLWIASRGNAPVIEFVLDLGQKRTVEAVTLRNRADTLTSYNVNRIEVEVGSSDDGQSFDRKVAEGSPAVSATTAELERFLPLSGAVQARYLRVKVLSNFFGPIGEGANGNVVQWQSIGISEPRLKSANSGLLDLDSLPANAFIVKSQGQSLFLAGKDGDGSALNDGIDAGTLFAVYEWLERQLGVRWVWPGELGTHIPRVSRLASGEINVLKKPPLLHSRLRRTLGRPVFTPGAGGYSAAQRAEVIAQENVWYRRNRFARGISLEYGHAYEDYWKRFGATHPEYSNLLPDGTRRSDPISWGKGAPHLISMAVANKGFQRQVIEDWKLKRSPQKPWINGWENDSEAKDISPEALAWDVRDPALGERWENRVENARREFLAGKDGWSRQLGSLSDRYAKFYLSLQELGREYDPHATVIGGAYANYSEPPLETKLNENIVVGIVPEYGWPITEQNSTHFEKQWLGWHNAGASLYLRPNYTLYGHNLPLITARRWARDFQLAYKNGMIATDYDSLTSMWSTQGINIYVLTRLHWNPEMKVDDIMQEYYALFGSASGEVKRYIEFWEALTEGRAKYFAEKEIGTDMLGYGLVQLFGHWPEFHQNTGKLVSPETFVEAAAILKEARKAAAGDELTLQRLAFLEAGLEDSRLSAQASAIFNASPEKANSLEMINAIVELDRFREQLAQKAPNAVSIDLVTWMENRKWNRALSNAARRGELLQKLPIEWQLRWDERNVGVNEKWFASPHRGDWQPIRVDAAWEKQPTGKRWAEKNGRDYDGMAWYKLQFKADEQWRGRKLSLLFEAVDESALVFLNGQQIGERKFLNANDWREPFFIELGNGVRYGQSNELVVRVEDKEGAGGIWKPVWIVGDL